MLKVRWQKKMPILRQALEHIFYCVVDTLKLEQMCFQENVQLSICTRVEHVFRVYPIGYKVIGLTMYLQCIYRSLGFGVVSGYLTMSRTTPF